MSRDSTVAFLIALLSIAVAWAAAVPLQAGTNALRRELYGPDAAEFFSPYLEDHDPADPLNSVDEVNVRRYLPFGPTRRYFESPTLAMLDHVRELSADSRRYNGQSNKIHPSTLERFDKRNIDEIDRTAFDNFFKRNLDEIDRVGWSGFVKRLHE